MQKYAVIKTGGKQYRVSEGDLLRVERLSAQSNDAVVFEQVLLYKDNGTVTVGTPLVPGVVVSGTVTEQLKGEKIRVAKYKAKVRYRRVTGHRQHISQVRIDQIGKRVKSSDSSQDKKVNQATKSTEKKNLKTKH